MLDIDETNQLVSDAKLGNELAKEKLLSENSPLIKSVIKKYINKGIEFDDLYQLGCLGFLKAINNFDISFGVKFSTYAVPMIAGEVKRFLRDNGIIKVSRSTKQLNVRINKFMEEYLSNNQVNPSIDIIAKEFGLTEQEVIYAMDSSCRPVSLNMMVGDGLGKEQCLIDKVESEMGMESIMDNQLLYKIISDLNPRDRKIIILRYFRDKTQKDIAMELGVSQVQNSRLESKILDIIKNKFQ